MGDATGWSTPSFLALTEHGRWRARRQNLAPEDLRYVMVHGSEHRAAGACFCYLRGKDVPTEDRNVPAIARLVGTTLVLDARGAPVMLTCYRRPRGGFRGFRRLERYSRFGRTST